MVKYSVIVPVYNVEKHIRRALKSLVEQKYRNFEIILINDGSTDKSGDICNEYSENYDNVKVLHQKNAGSGKARQNGINHAEGEYVVFVDPDDYLHTEALKNNAKVLETNRPDVLINGYTGIQKNLFGKTAKKQYNSAHQGTYNRQEFINIFSSLNKTSLKPLWNKVYRLNFLKENDIVFSSQRLGQDVIYNYNVFKYVEKIIVNDKAYYNYDSTREGSAVNKYWDKRLQYELNIHDSFLELIDSFGNPLELYQDKLVSLWYAIVVEIRNINYAGSPYTTRNQRVIKIQEICDLSVFKEVFDNLNKNSINSFVSKCCFILLKEKRYELTQLFISTYVRLK